MPSKPAVTGKCQCFNNPTPLMSVSVECVCSLAYAAPRMCVPEGGLEEPCRAYSKLVLCTPENRGGNDKKGYTLCVSQHPQPSRLSGAISSKPSHLNTGPPQQQQLIVQLLLLVNRSWKLSSSTSNYVKSEKQCRKKLMAASEKRHQDL
ncbi:hypothetical protein JOB18_047921 [Xyrichtys novacula]|uniref:Uncharacterized protein n=1 Tax=Xyrichtys novacula TaxID=13765 RepID=A0AAV1HB46_XYRNO|nr:hypothetical protein JOB18_047921 [Xyrichtys novacula]